MNHRKLRIAWSVAWGIAAVLLIALWVRSTRTSDRLHGRLWGNDAFVLSAKEGCITTVVFTWTRSRNWWDWEMLSRPVDDEFTFPIGPVDKYVSRLGFGWINRPTYNTDISKKLLEPLRRGPLVTEIFTIGLVNSGVMATKASLRLNGAGPLVPIWCLVALTTVFAALPWIQSKCRFSLRALLIATTLVAIGLGLIVWLR